MNNRMIVGLGNAGCMIVREIANTPNLTGTKLYAIDSTTSNIDIHTALDIEYVCTISDENQGSGRNRERGAAMYKFHEANGDFEKMYKDAANAKSPVIVISSAAGGTGSGSIVPLCKKLLSENIKVIPVIIYPNEKDPIAYHLNANDLLIELGEVGVLTYSIFVNPANTVKYDDINREVVDLVEILYGHKYHKTDVDSIDDSDINTILETPGRFMAFSSKGRDVEFVKRDLMRKLISGYQPGWDPSKYEDLIVVKAFSMSSMFAKDDYDKVFSDIEERVGGSFDTFKNISNIDNDGIVEATALITGLPRHQVKEIDTEFNEVSGIGDGMKRSVRPSFLSRRKATITKDKTGDGDATSKFNWN